MPDSPLVEAERGACSINDGPNQGHPRSDHLTMRVGLIWPINPQCKVSDDGAIEMVRLDRGRRPKAAKERTRGRWCAESAAHLAMGFGWRGRWMRRIAM